MTTDRYDFNECYAPLPVLDQGTARTCWYHQWAVHLAAFRRMYDDKVTAYDPYGYTYTEDADGGGFVFHLPDGDMHIRNYSGADDPHYWPEPLTPEVIKAAILGNGVIEVSVPSRAPAFENVPHGDFLEPPTDFYVVHADASSPDAPLDHSNLAVGFTPDGVIDQNSWGSKWGWNGRVVLGWDFLARYGCWFQVDTYDTHPADGLVLPKRSRRYMIFKLEGTTGPAWMALGGVRVKFPTEAVLLAQGYTAQDVKTVPQSSPLWHLPVLDPTKLPH